MRFACEAALIPAASPPITTSFVLFIFLPPMKLCIMLIVGNNHFHGLLLHRIANCESDVVESGLSNADNQFAEVLAFQHSDESLGRILQTINNVFTVLYASL